MTELFDGINNAGAISDTLGNKMYNSPLYFVYAGDLYGGALWWSGRAGVYWPSVVQSASDAYHLDFNPALYPSNIHYRGHCHSVRCVAK